MWTHKVLCCLCAPSYQKATWFTWNGTLCDIHVGHEIQSSRGNTICGAWDLLWLCHIVMDRYTSESLYNPVGRSKLSTMPVCSDNITVGILGWKLAANVLVHLATVSHQQCVKYIKLMKLKALYSSWHIRPLTHWWQRLQCNARWESNRGQGTFRLLDDPLWVVAALQTMTLAKPVLNSLD